MKEKNINFMQVQIHTTVREIDYGLGHGKRKTNGINKMVKSTDCSICWRHGHIEPCPECEFDGVYE